MPRDKITALYFPGAFQDLNQAIELCNGRGKVACQAYTQRGLIKRLEGKFCCQSIHITKTYLYNFNPLKPHFYIVKLGFTGVFMINFFYFAKT